MLIKRIINSSILYRLTHNNIFFSSQVTQINRKQLLQQTLQYVQLKKSSSIILDEEDEIQRKKNKKLTKQDKLKLGLYVPKVIINTRMNIQAQNSYRQILCENLYDLQRLSLKTGLRILQKQTQLQKFTMNKYINAVYKDIYARFLISKGIGIQWNGKYSAYGVLNSQKRQFSPFQMIQKFLQINVNEIEKVKSIAPYSYLTGKFVSTIKIQVENLRKIGYYFKLPLVEFGKHTKSFEKLKQQGQKVQLLIFTQYLQKLINPNNLCVMPGHKMIILKRNQITQNQSQNFLNPSQINLQKQYLITSTQIFNKHKQLFLKDSYQKHLLFDSQHLIGMKVQFKLKNNQDKNANETLTIIEEIQGFQRNPGIYLVNGATNLPDYQRVMESQQNNVNLKNPFDQRGNLQILNQQKSKVNLSITDIQFQQKLHEILKSQMNFIQLYDVFQDQIYSNKQTSQLLRFKIFEKYQINLKPKNYQHLHQFIQASSKQQSITIKQSKISLPQRKQFKKPRQRRQWKKQVKQTLKQKTSYMSLKECIDSISNIPISSSEDSNYKIQVNIDNQGRIIKFISSQNKSSQPLQQQNLTDLNLSHDFISAFTYIFGTIHSQFLPAIVIQPQAFTQQILPLSLHLISYLKQPQKRGRRASSSSSTTANKILDSIKMIYLHPTLKQSQKQLQVDSFIQGSMKIINKKNYGYGYQAMRLWVCRNSDYLGDREVLQKDVNEQLKIAAMIRKVYSQILPLLPKDMFNLSSQQSNNTNIQSQLTFLDRFMLHQIQAYVMNMQHFYSKMMLTQAYQYTIQFFKDIIDEIFIQTIRKNIIAYPNQKSNYSHGIVIKKIIQLLAVISPLFPFSVYHISKTNVMKWPIEDKSSKFFQNLLEYNALIKIRTQLRNKLLINKLQQCQILFPSISSNLQYSQKDIQLFLGVNKVHFPTPIPSRQQKQLIQKKFTFKLRYNQTFGGKQTKLQVYQANNNNCIRCNPKSKQKDYLCKKCMDYLEENVGKQVQYYDQRNNALLINDQSQRKKDNLGSLDYNNKISQKII